MKKILLIVLFNIFVHNCRTNNLFSLFNDCRFFDHSNFDCTEYIITKNEFPLRNNKVFGGNVSFLNFSGNKKNSITIPDAQFNNLRIQEMKITNIVVLFISKHAFQNVTFVEELKFYGIQSLSISSNAEEFRHLRYKLKMLELQKINHNDFSRYLSLLKMLNTIEVLDMSFNNLEYIPDLQFMNRLTVLKLGANLIKNLHIHPLGMSHLPSCGSLPKSLRNFEMWQNLLTSLNDTSIFKNLDNLEHIDFSQNKINAIDNYAFERNNISKVYDVINFMMNPITRIENKAFCSKMHKNSIKIKNLVMILSGSEEDKKQIVNSCIFKNSVLASLSVYAMKCDCNINFLNLENTEDIYCEQKACKNSSPSRKLFEEECENENFSCDFVKNISIFKTSSLLLLRFQISLLFAFYILQLYFV